MTRLLWNACALMLLMIPLGCKHAPAPTRTQSERVIPPSLDVPDAPVKDPTLLGNLDTLQTSVQAQPENVMVRFDYLTALDRAGKYDQALDQARELGKMQGDNPYRSAAYLTFARIVLDDIPKDNPKRSDLLKEAVDLINVALQAEPDSVPSHLALGRLALETGDKDTALHHLAIALAASEIGYKLRVQMAEIYIERKDFEKARAHLEAAQTLAEKAGDQAALGQIRGLLSRVR